MTERLDSTRHQAGDDADPDGRFALEVENETAYARGAMADGSSSGAYPLTGERPRDVR